MPNKANAVVMALIILLVLSSPFTCLLVSFIIPIMQPNDKKVKIAYYAGCHTLIKSIAPPTAFSRSPRLSTICPQLTSEAI